MVGKKGFLDGLFGGDQSKAGCCSRKMIEETTGCRCGGAREKVVGTVANGGGQLNVKVLGTGCKSCHALLENAQAALEQMDSSVKVDYVTDIAEVASYGVMSTPALVINNKVVSMGKVLKPADIIKLLQGAGF